MMSAITTAELARLTKLNADLVEALEKIDAIERATGYQRCIDCDYPDECSETIGCVCLNKQGGTSVQVLVAAVLDKAKAVKL